MTSSKPGLIERAAVAEPQTPEQRLAELEQFYKSCGIIEIAIRNINVKSYMDHWEGRAEKAESELTRYRSALEGARAFIDGPGYPRGEDEDDLKDRAEALITTITTLLDPSAAAGPSSHKEASASTVGEEARGQILRAAAIIDEASSEISHSEAVVAAEKLLAAGLLATPTTPQGEGAKFVEVTGLPEHMVADIEAHVRGATEKKDTYEYELGSGWRCFHCGEMFRTAGGAKLHFGDHKSAPVCVAHPSLSVPMDSGTRDDGIEAAAKHLELEADRFSYVSDGAAIRRSEAKKIRALKSRPAPAVPDHTPQSDYAAVKCAAESFLNDYEQDKATLDSWTLAEYFIKALSPSRPVSGKDGE